MPADIDVLLASEHSISFTPNYHLPYSENHHHHHHHHGGKTLPLGLLNHHNHQTTAETHFTFHGRCTSPLQLKNLAPLRIQTAVNNNSNMPVAVPRRPCLVVRCEEVSHPLDSPSKHKKRVIFADDRGFPLTKVKTMTEPSNEPPRWSLQFLAQITQGAYAEVTPEPWEPLFPQPASDYLDFRRRLDTLNVSLENVIVRETEQAVMGTVKVRNLAYQKEVVIRVTSDSWKTHEDVYCTYVQTSPSVHGVAVLYDTFSFRLTLPPRLRNLEFCVRFRCDNREYWDNNNGKNYFIVKKERPSPVVGTKVPADRNIDTQNRINLFGKFGDLRPNATIDSWSEFASWNHLTNDTPYW